MSLFDKRIPELDPRNLLPMNGAFPWYDPATDTTYRIAASDLLGGVMADPGSAWNEVGIYDEGDLVTHLDQVWISDAGGNQGNPPGPASAFWTLEPDVSGLGFTPENVANKSQPNGYASLDGSGKVPSGELPSYVDDVLEFADFATFPGVGEAGKIFVDIATNLAYRWSGSAYILVTSIPSDASETVKGIAEIAIQAETDAGADDLRIVTPKKLSKAVQDGKFAYATATGTNTYIVGFTPAVAALVAGQMFRVLFTNANTTAATLNVDGLGAISLKKNGTSNLASGDILAGQILTLIYDGTSFQISSFYGLNITAAQLAAIPAGETNLFTVSKSIDGLTITYGAGVQQVDNFAPAGLGALLADTAAWNGDTLSLAGDNRLGALGVSAQEFVITNSLGTIYKCITHVIGTTAGSGSAVWIRTRSKDNTVSGAVIALLETESGWDSVNNSKVITTRSIVGSWYTSLTGYTYFCFDEVTNTSWSWRRIGQPNAVFVQITDATLMAEIAANNFLTTPLLTPVATVKGEDRQQHYWESPAGTPHLAMCVDIAGVKKWIMPANDLVLNVWLTKTVNVPSAEVLTLFSVPKLLVSSPAAGYGLVASHFVFRKSNPTTPYETNTTLRVYLGSASTPIITDLTDFLTNGGARVQVCPIIPYGNTTISANHIYLYVMAGDPTVGTGNIEVDIIYKIVNSAGI